LGAGLGPTPDNMNNTIKLESSSLEETRGEFNPRAVAIKLGIDVPQKFCVVVVQEGGGNPKPAQRFKKKAFLYWAAGLKQKRSPVPFPPIALINSRKLSELMCSPAVAAHTPKAF
jgi:hypothetical protein